MAMLTLSSSAFGPGSTIPSRYTGDGPDVSPPLAWRGAPAGTASFALIVDDPDAPDPAAPKRTWVHWLVCDLPTTATSLPDGASGHALPDGAREGKNDSGDIGYGGPYPPIGRHRYFFTLYALSSPLQLPEGYSKGDLLKAMEGKILESAELIGTYQLASPA